MINEHLQKIKDWARTNKSDLYVATIIFVVGLAGFGLGRLSVLRPEKEPITLTNEESQTTKESSKDNQVKSDPSSFGPKLSAKGKYVASKNGTAYHFPWCPGALNIKEKNKVWFETKEEAERSGYKAAANCKGL